MRVGFTGSRGGLNPSQESRIEKILLENGATHVSHGDCVGADTRFHEVALKLGLDISIFPPDKKGLRSFLGSVGKGTIHAEKSYIKRNHDIVNSCDFMIACPDTNKEKLRSGTWATIRYARKHNKRIYIVPAEISGNENSG